MGEEGMNKLKIILAIIALLIAIWGIGTAFGIL
mgnify:CR=1 FL=1